MAEPVEVIKSGTLRSALGTPAMHREVAVETPGLWAGTVRTDADMESGWHHHGTHHSVIYILDGRLRMDFGPGGAESVEAEAGDFISVPPGAIHREASPGDYEVFAVVIRSGQGEVVFNVDGPEPA
ncbi:MAG: cupin domain-containing protein [Actinomycetota bacterium]